MTTTVLRVPGRHADPAPVQQGLEGPDGRQLFGRRLPVGVGGHDVDALGVVCSRGGGCVDVEVWGSGKRARATDRRPTVQSVRTWGRGRRVLVLRLCRGAGLVWGRVHRRRRHGVWGWRLRLLHSHAFCSLWSPCTHPLNSLALFLVVSVATALERETRLCVRCTVRKARVRSVA